MSSKAISDRGEAASLSALRARVAALEAQIAESARQAAVASNEAVRTGEGPRQKFDGPRAFFERMKAEDPARFVQMTNRIARAQQERRANQLARREYLMAVNAEQMSDHAQKTHADYLAVLSARDALESRFGDPDLTDEARHALMGEMRELHGRLHELAGRERQNLLNETMRELGFDDGASQEICATVQDIIEATESGFGFGRGRGRPRGAPAPR